MEVSIWTPSRIALACAMVCGGHRRQIRAHFSPQVYVHYLHYLHYLRSLRHGR